MKYAESVKVNIKQLSCVIRITHNISQFLYNDVLIFRHSFLVLSHFYPPLVPDLPGSVLFLAGSFSAGSSKLFFHSDGLIVMSIP